ncbi:NAD-dependent epimerase/dehydratase family protein [Brevundimonas sp. TSRC1-1]|uniref:NAD-dependent epimerase/dehydratase family protein n=1 Tax=Brevundimonas sp. TSRC1-1 TaxID=2804562 RepID=UPI003CE7DBEA
MGTATVIKSALVTGASGFIGTHLIRGLAAEGVKVIAIDLRPPRERIDGVEYVTADVRDLKDFNPAFVPDCIYNFAAVHTTPGHPDHEYYDTNVNGALEVTTLADRLGVPSIIFTSSISIYGPSEERKAEDSAPKPVSAYGKSKLMAERIHKNWCEAQAMRKLVVVRPAVVFGPGEGGNFARMASLLKKGFFVFPGGRGVVKSCIYVGDLIRLIRLAQDSGAKFTLFNGAYPDEITIGKIVSSLQAEYFQSAKLIDIPAGAVIVTAKVIGTLGGGSVGFHPDRVRKLLTSTNIAPTWAIRQSAFSEDAFGEGLKRWAEETKRSFI